MNIVPTTEQDISELQVLVEETGMFPADMVPELLARFLAGDTGEYWLTCRLGEELAGFCYAVEETLAEGSWNMLAIAVLPSLHGNGIGSNLVTALETELRARNARILIAETSGTPAFAPARAIYSKAGYAQEARIRDFWADGDDKVVFWKSLHK
jgi:ribosomal protein S18 acetylase RimI-like enzyme